MLSHRREAATGSGPNSTRLSLMAAVAHFAAQAQVDIEDKALAHRRVYDRRHADRRSKVGFAPPQAMIAAARFSFARDQLKVARAEIREEGFEDECEARLKGAEKTVGLLRGRKWCKHWERLVAAPNACTTFDLGEKALDRLLGL